MRQLAFFLTVISIIIFYFTACEKKCWQAPCSDPINFQLIDKLSQQDLVFGINPKYKLDSMQLNKLADFNLGHHQNFLSSIYGDYNGLQTARVNASIDTTYLRLTFNDIDTLIINHVYEDNECCSAFKGYGKIISIKYNGQTTTKNGEFYKFEK